MSAMKNALSSKTRGVRERVIYSIPRGERQLTVYEKKFLLCAERGDIAAVRDLLDTHRNNSRFDINCLDPLGRSALVVAIENENLDLIELLLKYGIRTKDALLHAINEEFVEAVETLLRYEEKLHRAGQAYSWELVDRETAAFTPDMTPLTVAAHQDNYEILKVLLDRGATLPTPHDIRCGCDLCLASIEEDCLKHSQSRINAYKALTSPSLIALSSRDPILTAFELSWELQKLRSMEKEFKVQYTELRDKCQEFATSLLDHTRTTYELEVILNYDPKGLNLGDQSDDTMKLERLKLAILYKQKTFVAHPNVQQLLASLWYEGMPGFRRKGTAGQFIVLYKLGLLLPFYALAYIIAPKSKIGRTMKYPFTKFIFHSTSYLFFLFLLILASQRVETWVMEIFGTDIMREWVELQHKQERGQLPGYVECGIIIYVIGFIWWEIKQLWDAGIEDYMKDMWNILDFITNALYCTWIALRIVAWYLVRKELAAEIDAYQPREKWHPYDPMLISEGMFGAANIFSFLKMVHIFSVNPYLGPLQISLGRMVYDIIKFFFIYTLVLFAFGCGMNQLLWYYAELDKDKCYGTFPRNEESRSCEVWRRFANLFETSQSLFWASFGLVDIHNFDLTGIQEYTRFWGLLMFGSYCVINVVVLLNLLIAMMSNSYQIISERSDVEWKFARSKLWMDYFEEGGTLPPPFNIIPSLKSFRRLFGCRKKRRSVSVKVKEVQSRIAQYESVIRCLVRRYVTAQQKKAEVRNVTEDDVSEVKQLVTSFRSELFDILRDNGMRCTHVTYEREGGRKEKVRERRLLKDFNIGIVDRVFDTVFRRRSSGGVRPFEIVRQISSKRSKAKRNWNTIAASLSRQQNQIGSSGQRLNDSITDLREMVLKEQDPEIRRKMVLRRFANIARKARLMHQRSILEVVEEMDEGSCDSESVYNEQGPFSSLADTSSKELHKESLDASDNLTGSLECLLQADDNVSDCSMKSSENTGEPKNEKTPETATSAESPKTEPQIKRISKDSNTNALLTIHPPDHSGKSNGAKEDDSMGDSLRMSHYGVEPFENID